jgi:photosystem II stability/assembly factor-like uncharacterized protein
LIFSAPTSAAAVSPGWTFQTADVAAITSISCKTSQHCLLVGFADLAEPPIVAHPPVIENTVDGGEHWTAQGLPSVTGSLNSVDCADAMHCWAVGATTNQVANPGGLILVTSDGGVSWAPQSTPADVTTFSSISCSSASTCWAGGQHRVGLRS